MKKYILFAFLFSLAKIALSEDIISLESQELLTLTSDSLNDGEINNLNNYYQSTTLAAVESNFQNQSNYYNNPVVILIPGGDVKSSYTNKSDNETIIKLRRAINVTQLQFKNENDYIPVTNKQTVDRIQSFFGQKVQAKLAGCNLNSELVIEDADNEAVFENLKSSYAYIVNFGVTYLIINNTLFGTTLNGEANAMVSVNNQLKKKLLVGSFNGGKVSLEKQSRQDFESDNELKLATSLVVEALADRMGDKLCKYFN